MRNILTQEQRALFPLRTLSDVIRLYALELDKRRPSLALLSIVTGAVEQSLTASRPDVEATPEADEFAGDTDSVPIPALEYDTVFALYAKFAAIVVDAVELKLYDRRAGTPRELVKRVSDVVWVSLARSYHKDKPHIQSLYSFLTANRLDSLGVALAVVAACRLLELDDVLLALSEDHAWLVFGKDATESCEVTWHGKGNEDKRGQPVCATSYRSWLYLNGHPVVCNTHMQVAAAVSVICRTIAGAADSMELVVLQQQLLWMLYDRGALSAFPIAIDTLAELEEEGATTNRPKPLELYQKAVCVARERYENHHVYPYVHLGAYYYRKKQYELALETWANAADALRHYDYSRDDEAVYKKLMEVTIDHIPHIIKEVGSGISAHSLLREPTCYLHLLRFYDGLCQWEQGSHTPVLHIGWAKQMVGCVAKFDPQVRSRVSVSCANAAERQTTASNGSSELPSPDGGGAEPPDAADGDGSALTAAADPNGNEPPAPLKLERTGGGGGVVLLSEKMAGLRDLLTSERFNPQAMSLQLTAQSQVSRRHRDDDEGRRSKRQRRADHAAHPPPAPAAAGGPAAAEAPAQ